ncbi:unnamed protein product [Toxocara canis]|uniref:Uncharacterized protein n=1 Tax=Toxocara canis TaxID=6265 RepID=A0A183UE11_TOXCA|nr:unnamed protein product [Toxocara canis]
MVRRAKSSCSRMGRVVHWGLESTRKMNGVRRALPGIKVSATLQQAALQLLSHFKMTVVLSQRLAVGHSVGCPLTCVLVEGGACLSDGALSGASLL